MQIRTDGQVLLSPSDLSTWATCEWAFLRRLDAKLGRGGPLPDEHDDMLERTARLGDQHELDHLEILKRSHDVVEFERPAPPDYASAAAAARQAFQDGADVLYQPTFFEPPTPGHPGFIGFADFILRNDAGEYEVYDTKLARHAKISALLQLAAYAERMQAHGIPTGRQVHLVLGDRRTTTHDLGDIAPVYRTQRAELERVIAERLDADDELRWGDPRYSSCGRCAICQTQVQQHRDLVLVAGMRLDQRTKLIRQGVRTIDDLADRTAAVPGMSRSTQDRLVRQARLQTETEAGQDAQRRAGWPTKPRFEVLDARALDAIPAPDPGDVFFDFEGDPLHTEDGVHWGLDYLFGLVDDRADFTAFWAHTIRDERQALLDFLEFIAERREQHPDMHVYHYAAYERTHLLSLAARHGVGEDAVDDLLRAGVLVDLYPVVRKALVVGSHSYSIKKLEPLYMGDDLRLSDVTNAADSITAYVEAIEERRNGDPAEGQRMLDQVADYNAYDCRSTLRLRDWLLSLRPPRAEEPVDETLLPPIPVEREPNPVSTALAAEIADVDPLDRDADQTALALAAAAIDYHRREAKTFWQDHFDRLRNPVDDWADTRDVLVVERASVERDWGTLPRARAQSREIRLSGTLAPGSRIRPGGTPHLVYDDPLPASVTSPGPGSKGASARAVVLDAWDDGDAFEVLVKESLPVGGGAPHDAFPVALAPAAPPRAKPQPEAIAEWGQEVLDALPSMLPDPALDLLRRVPPRGALAPVVGDDTVGAVVTTLLGLDRSYLAIQGPPGTGKTYVGSNVVARLVREYGWRVGVVGQSHATSENFLSAVVRAGVRADRVVKVPKSGATEDDLEAAAWTAVKNNAAVAAFLSSCAETGTGGVVGGTAWTFANEGTIPRRSLDLLVVDEAGQFSLAPTIASSIAATRLLLLGDPQQLPQVSQGSHPEPVDQSALGWLADGEHVLPAEFGYFLARTRRMEPALTAAVSGLSYDGQLASMVSGRHLDGLEPGVHAVPVLHSGNTTSSVEEAERVVALARDVVGRSWTDDDGITRDMTDEDVIVVAPYNAQGAVIRAALDAAGLRGTQVGTVDMFQGREAVVSITSLAASSAADIPRGLDFLLMPNRLNVALSRAKWAAYLVYSPALTTGLPPSIAGLSLLSRFIELVEPSWPDQDAAGAGARAGAGAGAGAGAALPSSSRLSSGEDPVPQG
ncbi:TM0106 family RecB-like putative nuclease [Curtobacterium sp. MCBA15_012]|uniref:TM0106 family RecB-like putative nuclease n=1 Tax=Curtobacterium sp. MCBA15_012 TaxID=1898738 RepID=UPI0008DD29F6|nr:TM0106 family RecB-like putative nuclease [Curtobacterium sp. MCBA15_012]WIB01284.1 TM0106 family RecB-like putative nuclease [Curtobacterium sp. MCBA15_012]